MCSAPLVFSGLALATIEFHCSDLDPRGVVSGTRTWMCLICGWIYDEAAGLPDEGIPPGTRWQDVPMNWVCPECGARKDDFEMVPL